MRDFFKNLPDTTTPLNAQRMNGFLNGNEAMGSIVVGDIECKNIVDISQFKNGYLDPSGGVVSNSSNLLNEEKYCDYIEVKPNTTYTFTIFETSSNYEDWIGIQEFDASKTFITRIVKTNSKTFEFTTNSNTYYVRLSARNLASATKVQFELGTATSYAPHKSLGYTSGTNENGSWVKYDDGRLEVKGLAVVPANVGFVDVTLPIEFIDTDYIVVASHKYTGGSEYGAGAQVKNIVTTQPFSKSTARIFSYFYDCSIASYIRNVQYIAKGRWK